MPGRHRSHNTAAASAQRMNHRSFIRSSVLHRQHLAICKGIILRPRIRPRIRWKVDPRHNARSLPFTPYINVFDRYIFNRPWAAHHPYQGGRAIRRIIRTIIPFHGIAAFKNTRYGQIFNGITIYRIRIHQIVKQSRRMNSFCIIVDHFRPDSSTFSIKVRPEIGVYTVSRRHVCSHFICIEHPVSCAKAAEPPLIYRQIIIDATVQLISHHCTYRIGHGIQLAPPFLSAAIGTITFQRPIKAARSSFIAVLRTGSVKREVSVNIRIPIYIIIFSCGSHEFCSRRGNVTHFVILRLPA